MTLLMEEMEEDKRGLKKVIPRLQMQLHKDMMMMTTVPQVEMQNQQFMMRILEINGLIQVQQEKQQ